MLTLRAKADLLILSKREQITSDIIIDIFLYLVIYAAKYYVNTSASQKMFALKVSVKLIQ